MLFFRVKLGAPTRELYIDDKWYQCYFGGPSISVDLNGQKVNVQLDGPPPQVKIGTVKRIDLVYAKTYIVINAGIKTPIYLDSKTQV